MRRLFFLLLFLLVFLSGCGPDYSLRVFTDPGEYRRALTKAHQRFIGDTTLLAEYKGGGITRADLVRYAVVNYGLEAVVGTLNRFDCLLSSLRRQKLLLTEMMEKRVLLKEARRRGFDKTPEILALTRYADQRLLIPIHKKMVIEKSLRIREPSVEVAHIFLRFARVVPDIANRQPAWVGPVKKQAEDIRKQILASGDFSGMVSRFSQDFTKKRGGRLGWIVRGAMGDTYWEAVRYLPVGGISRVILTETGVYIAKVLARKTLTKNDYQKHLHGRFAFTLLEAKRKEARERYLAGLFKRPGVLLNRAALEGGASDAIVAAVGNWQLSRKEYEAQFAAFSKGYKANTFAKEKREKWRLRFLKEYLMAPRLIVADALRLGLDKTEAFAAARKKNLQVRERIIYREMKTHLFMTGPGNISEKQIKQVFEKHKHKKYFSKKPITPQEAGSYPEELVIKEGGRVFLKVVLPFEQVKERAVASITRDIRAAWLDDYFKKKFKAIGFRFAPLKKFEVLYYGGKRR